MDTLPPLSVTNTVGRSGFPGWAKSEAQSGPIQSSEISGRSASAAGATDGWCCAGRAAAFLMTEKSFRKIQGYRDLWMLKAVLDQTERAVQQQVA